LQEQQVTRTSHLKGSKNLQSFKGGIVSGVASGSGTGTTTGSALANNDDEEYAAGFTSTSGSSGAINTKFGNASGSATGGATGEQTVGMNIIMADKEPSILTTVLNPLVQEAFELA
jgi:hypothetical protein